MWGGDKGIILFGVFSMRGIAGMLSSGQICLCVRGL